MAIFVSDTFTESTTVELSTHTGETGATWAKHIDYSGGSLSVDSIGDRVYCTTASTAGYYASGTPAGAEYDIEFDLYIHSNDTGSAGIMGRVDTSSHTLYFVRYNQSGTEWQLYKIVNGTVTLLDSAVATLTVAQTYACRFEIRDNSQEFFVDDVSTLSATDTEITAAGVVGIRSGTARSANTGYHIDNFIATDAGGAAGPAITDINTDEIVAQGETAVPITGTTFEATQGTGTVKICSADNIATNPVTQTVTSWADTAIQFTANFTGTTVVEGGTAYVFVTNNTGDSNTTGFQITNENITAPVLSGATGTATGPTTATGNVTTTGQPANGNIYRYTSQSITPPSPADNVSGAGADAHTTHAVTTEGAQTLVGITGLTNSATYYNHFYHVDGDGLASNQDTSASFTTSALPTITTDPLINYSGTVQASQSGWVANVYTRSTGVLVVRKTGLSTDASGVLSFTDALLSAATSYLVTVDNGTLFGSQEIST